MRTKMEHINGILLETRIVFSWTYDYYEGQRQRSWIFRQINSDSPAMKAAPTATAMTKPVKVPAQIYTTVSGFVTWKNSWNNTLTWIRIRRRIRFVFFISSSSESWSTWASPFLRPPEVISCSTKDSKTLYARTLLSQRVP